MPIMMAGNGIVLSHSKNVTGCAYAIGEAFRKAGAPEGAFEVILIATEDIVNVMNDERSCRRYAYRQCSCWNRDRV